MEPVFVISAIQDVLTTIVVGAVVLTGGWMVLRAYTHRKSVGGGDMDRLTQAVDQLTHAVDDLRADLGEVQERLDFTERLLASGKPPGAADPS